MPSRINQSRSWCFGAPVIIACLLAASVAAQTAWGHLGLDIAVDEVAELVRKF
jgi:hypothetical protein